MKKGVFLSALFSLLGLFLCVQTAYAGTYTYKDGYSVSITTTAVDATGTITLPRQSNGLKYTATLSVTTDPNTSCLPNCLYYKEVSGIDKNTIETFNLKGLDPTKKYYLIISDTDKKHSIQFQVDGVKRFNAEGSTTAIAASLTGLRGNTNSFRLLVLNRPFETADIKRFMLGGVEATPGLPLHSGAEVIKKPDTNGEIRWNLGSFTPGTTYYARVIEYSDPSDPSKASYTTEQKVVTTQAATITPEQLVFEYSNRSLLIKGRVDPAKNIGFEKYDIKIQYSREEFTAFTDSSPFKYSIYPGHTVAPLQSSIPNEKGEYHLFIPSGITPSTKYNVRETITLGGTKKISDRIYNSGTGYTPATAENLQSDFEDRSYRLLAPFPGLKVFLDPDLCAERARAGITGEACDINDFLNLGFKILIGAAAVLLVLRIMYEGYKYITTDIPALKTSAKSGLKDAVLGLVLALSSFLILNTINPKLVENTVNVDRLEIGVLVDEEDSAPTLTAPSGAVPSGKIAACTLGVEKVTVSGVSFWACKSISTKFKNMLSAANVAGFKLSGGGFRTQQEQIALRKKNCGEANVYKTNAICSPKTAPPGTSRHESGLAFDLQCNGKLINFDKQNPGMGIHPETKACFEWLTRNAGTYGLKNLKGENWHWSVDGK